MKYRTLGRTGLSVSEIGFGAWAIGGTSYGPTRDEDSLDALEAAWEHGVNFFDTADTYGHGHSEELIGRFLKGKRDQAVIATKAGWDFYHGGSRQNFDPDYIRFACGESLRRLATDRIDLYQLHNPRLEILEQGGLFQVLEELKREGKVRYYGVSVHTPAEALAVIRSGKADTLQLIFNLIDQRPVLEVFPEAVEKNIGIIAREPLACGFLTGKYSGVSAFPKTDHRNGWSREKKELDLQKLSRLRASLKTERVSPVEEALEFVLSFEAVSAAIPGAKTRLQVLQNLKASEDPKLRIEEISVLRRVYESDEIFKTGFYRN
ncbi:MAG: aldo/keto reductase [Candidatus Omnitrophica bacterium]|nr:aldo/keto reductase [Candidatus Omnitrophota bacterium]